jgi:hypothetical protein
MPGLLNLLDIKYKTFKILLKISFFLSNLLLIYSRIIMRGGRFMNNNYKIIRTIYENVFQRVLECTDNDTGDTFYSNIITSRKVINLINLEELRKLSSNILECYDTHDRIYIYTKPLKTEYKGLRECLSDSMTLKQQFSLSENVINLAQNIFNMTNVVQQKILDLDRLYVSSDNTVFVDLNLIFEQEYDITDNESFKRMGNIIHFIFSGSEIIDYNISDSIPPDILKIIVRCLTKEYMFPKDALVEMKVSPIYSMIFGTGDFEKKAVFNKNEFKEHEEYEHKEHEHKEPKSLKELEEHKPKSTYEESSSIKSEESTPVLDIYVNDNNAEKTNRKTGIGKEIVRILVSVIVVVLVLLSGNKLIKKLSESRALDAVTQGEMDSPKESQNTEISDSTEMYFNDKLLSDVGYTGSKAEIDSDIYVEGKNSLVVSNESEDKIKTLFAVVDFRDEKFNYLLKKQISITAEMKSESNVASSIVLEAYKNGSLSSNFHALANINDDKWSKLTVPINVTDADYLNIYIEYQGKNKIWIDSLYVDVIK